MREYIGGPRNTFAYYCDSTMDKMMNIRVGHGKTLQTITAPRALQMIILVLCFEQTNSALPSLRYSRHCGKFCHTCFSLSPNEELKSYRYNPFSGPSAKVSLINVCQDQIWEIPEYTTGPWSHCLVMRRLPTAILICDFHPSYDQLQVILPAHLIHTDVIEDIDIL